MIRQNPKTSTPESKPVPLAGQSALPQVQSVAQHLISAPYDFDFFQAVRLLHQLQPEKAPIGGDGPPRSEPVRLRAVRSLSFPPSAIHDLRTATSDRPVPELFQAFFGLFGPSGVLPRHYTQMLSRLELDSRTPERLALREWLDLFNHRLTSLFYRAWLKYRLPQNYERYKSRQGEPDPITSALFCLVGLGTPGLRGRLAVQPRSRPDLSPTSAGSEEEVLARLDDQALLRFAGLLSAKVRGAAALEGVIQDGFKVPAVVEQFRGDWMRLDSASQTRLGGVGLSSNLNNRLGTTAIVGERLWDIQGQFRIRLGPIGYDQFREFLPDRSPTPRRKTIFLLAQVVRLYAGPELDFDVQLVLRSEEVPQLQLGDCTESVGPRLGWNTWLGAPGGPIADDAAFAVDGACPTLTDSIGLPPAQGYDHG